MIRIVIKISRYIDLFVFSRSGESCWVTTSHLNRIDALATVFLPIFLVLVICCECFAANILEELPGTSVVEMTLQDAVGIALRHNRTVKSAHLERVAEKFDLKVAQDKFSPDVNLTASPKYSESDYQSEQYRSKSESTNLNAALDVTKLTESGGELSFTWNRQDVWERDMFQQDQSGRNSWQATFRHHLLKGAGREVNTASVAFAELNEKANLLKLKDTVSDTVNKTISTFRNVAQAIRQVEIADTSIQRAKNLVATNKSLIAVGRMPANELVQSEADLANQEFAYETSLNELDRARLRFLEVLDLDKRTRIKPIVQNSIEPVYPEYERCLKIAMQNRSDYLNAAFTVERAELERLLAEDNMKWDLDFTGDFSYSDTVYRQGSNATNKYWFVGLYLNIPLYGDLTREQRVIRAKTSQEQAQIALKEVEETIALEVQDAVRDVDTRLKQMGMAKRSRLLAERKLEVEKEKLKVGRSTNFQLVTFHNDLIEAQNAELDATVAYLNALTRLDEILGTTLDTWRIDYNREYDTWPGR